MENRNHQIFQSIPLPNVSINDRFWLPRLETNRSISLFHQYYQLEQVGVLDNFRRVIGQADGRFSGLYFSDSDLYKWLEAASYSLVSHFDIRLETFVDEAINLIAAAQEPSGYVNTYFQLVEPDKKFSNFGVCHELYTAGHLIQAAIAHYQATSKTSLLSIACRFADYITAIFGAGKLEAVDGHAGIEMALISLYRITGEQSYLKMSQYFIDQRGCPESRLRWELGHLKEIAGKLGKPGQNNRKFFNSSDAYDGRHAQDHLPVRQQSEVVGHAVRGMYLYCGMADLAAETGESELVKALERLWRHLTTRRLYITGGIGPARTNEGFTHNYDLPNDTACAESCAAVGMVMWNHRMLNLKGEGRYADLMEQVLYNALLVGVSLDGKKYFYNNPLSSNGDVHREEWYECACCPPNIARLLASMAEYIYSQFDRGLAVHLYIQSSVRVKWTGDEEVKLKQVTNYPWDGKVECYFEVRKPVHFLLMLRIPNWCRSYSIKINNQAIKTATQKGYAVIERLWSSGDMLELNLAMRIELIEAHPSILQDVGKVALQRGPMIYCVESMDNNFFMGHLVLTENLRPTHRFMDNLCGGVEVIEGEGVIPELSSWEGTIYRQIAADQGYSKVRFRAIPYYCWDNRQPGTMMVWLNYKNQF